MEIYVVKKGDNIYSIAKKYNVSWEKIVSDNEITNPNKLVVGQTIVILFPQNVHTVSQGETLRSIAGQYGVSVINLLQNNPSITDVNRLYAGQKIVISYEGEKLGRLSINGYAYPNIDRNVLIKTLPYLTYITLFTYGITNEGELIDIEDEELIQTSRDYGVAPLMLISTLTDEGTFSNELASLVLNDMNVQNKLIDNILNNLKAKNYYGLDVDFEYVFPQDRQKYVDFINNLRTRLNAEGYPVVVALAPKTSTDQPGLLYEGHDYNGLGKAANAVLIMTYEWGYTYGPPMAVAPINKVREVLDYAVTQISPDKIFMGIPNYGYDWTLPFVQGESRARSLSNVGAVEKAAEVGAEIMFDEISKAPYYEYYDGEGKKHVVWFEDARSIDAKIRLISEYNLLGSTYWNIMKYFPQNWLVVNSLYNINKVL